MYYLKNSLSDKELEIQWLKIREVFKCEYRHLAPADFSYQKGEFGKMLKSIGRKVGLTETQLRKKIIRWEDAAAHYF